MSQQRALVAHARRLGGYGMGIHPMEGLGEYLESLPPPTDPFWAELVETPS